MTDTVPFFGYRRKSYLLFFGVMGFVMWNLLAQYGIQNEQVGVGLLMGINVAIAFCNVIGEALLVELSGHTQEESDEKSKNPNKTEDDSASQNVTFFFGMRSFGTLLTAYYSGELLEHFDKKFIYQVTSIFPLLLALIALFIKEKKVEKTQNIRTSETLGEFVEFISQGVIYKPILLIFAFMASPSASTAMFYFYTNVLQFGPEFIGELRLMYSICSIMAAFLFNRFLKNVRFTKVFGCSTIIYFFISGLTIVLVTRRNVQWGIPDKVFCMGDGVLDQVVAELNTMPILVLACKMCPKNIEGTMYALLMSTINFGGMIAGQIGAILTYYFGVTDSDFENLWLLLLVTSASSLLPLPFIGIIKEDELMKAKEKQAMKKQQKWLEKAVKEEEVEQLLIEEDNQDIGVEEQQVVELIEDDDDDGQQSQQQQQNE